MNTYSLGIDIGGTHTSIGLVDKEGNVLATENLSTRQYFVGEEFLADIATKIIKLVQLSPEAKDLAGVGVAAPNGNYYHGTIEHAPNLNFQGIVYVKSILEAKLKEKGLPLQVTVTNDANAAAIGEMVYGGAKGLKDFIMITLGTGVGSGVVVDGKLVYGFDGFAGEVGHTIVMPEGRLCNCGRRGCVETYAAVTGLKRTALELLEKSDTPSVLRKLKSEEIGGKIICDAAVNGDELALKCFDVAAKVLAIGIANAVAITSPEKIFLFGGLTKSGEILLKPLKKYFEESLFVVFQNKIELELSHLDENNAAILGAAALAFPSQEREK